MFLGLEDNTVILRSYTFLWRWFFWIERHRLWLALQPLFLSVDVQHVGSTAIPGMPAKPVIDLLIVVEAFEQGALCIPRLEGLGYQYMGENDSLRQYRLMKGRPQTHSLFVVERQSKERMARLYFRDYLIAHPGAAKAYADLKLRLARQFPTDRAAYQAGKDAFIRQVLEQAGADLQHEAAKSSEAACENEKDG